MHRFFLISLPLLVLLPSLWASDKTEGEKPSTTEGRYQALMAEYKKALKESNEVFYKAKTDGERQTIRANFHKWRVPFIGRVLDFAEAQPEDKDVLLALFFVLHPDVHAERCDLNKAIRLLTKDHLTSDHLTNPPILLFLAAQDLPIGEAPLRAVLKKNPHHAVQAHACLGLALLLKAKAVTSPPKDKNKLTAEAEGLFERVVEKYADVKVAAKRAEAELFKMRHLAIGKAMPDIKERDSDDKEFKLSDYRGKVVVVTFWATWCPACMKMVPHEQSLVKRLKGRPFALVGVNLDESRETCKKCEEKNRMTWRSFFDGRDGPVRKTHDLESLPMTYVLDAEGVIRYKGVSGEEMDKAVDCLLAELKAKAKTDN